MYVSIGALVLLILILVVVGVAMSKMQSLVPFPPTQNACPDYWDVSANPNYCGVPVNAQMKNMGYIVTNSGKVDSTNKINIGMCTGNGFGCKSGSGNYLNLEANKSSTNFQYAEINNNDNWKTMYPGLTERCAKKKWANMMNVNWDGVSNYNGC